MEILISEFSKMNNAEFMSGDHFDGLRLRHVSMDDLKTANSWLEGRIKDSEHGHQITEQGPRFVRIEFFDVFGDVSSAVEIESTDDIEAWRVIS